MLRESLRRKRPVFTAAEKDELLESMLLERFTAPEPTLTEMHEQWVEANQERDRLQSLGRDAEERIAAIEARTRDNIKSRPAFRRQFESERDRLCRQWVEQREQAQAALAELNANVDWEVLQAGEKRFVQAVAAMMKAHNTLRVQTAREMAVEARRKSDEARAALSLDKPRHEVLGDYAKASELEVNALYAERAAAEVEKAVKGR